MKNNCLILFFCALLSACGGAVDVQVTSHNPSPSLVGFDVVDSYGVDTAYSRKSLAINPYINNGLFDVFWRVNSLEDYRVNILVSLVPDVRSSILVYSEVCGFSRACDQGGGVICEYTSDFYLSCNNARHPADIATLMKRVPQSAYLMLEVCDLDSPACSYRYYPVSLQ